MRVTLCDNCKGWGYHQPHEWALIDHEFEVKLGEKSFKFSLSLATPAGVDLCQCCLAKAIKEAIETSNI